MNFSIYRRVVSGDFLNREFVSGKEYLYHLVWVGFCLFTHLLNRDLNL